MMDALFVSPEQAFEMLGVGRAKGYQMIKAGELPSIKIGRLRRIPVAQLREWVETRVDEEGTEVEVE